MKSTRSSRSSPSTSKLPPPVSPQSSSPSGDVYTASFEHHEPPMHQWQQQQQERHRVSYHGFGASAAIDHLEGASCSEKEASPLVRLAARAQPCSKQTANSISRCSRFWRVLALLADAT
jgi:hypothetical protein